MKARLLCVLLLTVAARAQSITCQQATSAPSVQLTVPITCTATLCTATDPGVTNGSTYGYVATSNDLAGAACSNIVANVTIPATGTHSVALSWTPSTTPNVSYALFRASAAAAVTISATVN